MTCQATLAQALLTTCPRVSVPPDINLGALLARYPLCAQSFSEALQLSPPQRYPYLMAKRRQTLRTGWVIRGIVDGETVDEHVRGLVRLYTLWQGFVRQNGVVLPMDGHLAETPLMLEVHDDAEGITGDWARHDPQRPSREEKVLLERLAMHVVNQDSPLGEARIQAFEAHLDLRLTTAQLVHDLDAIQAVVVATYYDQTLANGLAIAEEFLPNVRARLFLPATRQFLEAFEHSQPLRQQLLGEAATIFAERTTAP